MARSRLTALYAAALSLLLLGMLAGPTRAGPTEESTEIQRLREQGGHGVTARLTQLAASRLEETRTAALEALAVVGIRTPEVARALDQAAERGAEGSEQAAFFAAIARVGGEHDVALLIDALKGQDQELRGKAHEALRSLTSQRFALNYGRWYQWWRKERPGLRATVRRAVDSLPDADDEGRERYRTILARDGWVDHEHVGVTVADWLSDGDRDVRRHAFHVIASLRLGAVGEEVESALPYLTGIDGEDGLQAVRALGLNPGLLSPYWRKRLADGR